MLMTVFIIIWSIWFVSEILINRLLRSGNDDKKGQDKGSIRLIWIMIGLGNSLGIIFTIIVRIPVSYSIFVPYTGLLLILIGMALRFYSIWSLGRLFTVDVTIRDNHEIKKNGVYRFIRHPSYLGSIISFIGFGLSLNNWVSLLIISVLVTSAMLYRINIEEKLLKQQFGSEYSDYMKNSYRLIPWVY
jgi:protein-S-isoprenylcysteine O-methyltransferase Ste14